MVDETCMPYKGNETGSCDHEKLSSCKRYYSNNHRYVGGFYGATTEYLMRRELYENGPVAIGCVCVPLLRAWACPSGFVCMGAVRSRARSEGCARTAGVCLGVRSLF